MSGFRAVYDVGSLWPVFGSLGHRVNSLLCTDNQHKPGSTGGMYTSTTIVT